MIDQPESNDNRNYDYSGVSTIERAEYNIIVDWVDSGKRILDLGCGDGSLMNLLREQKQSTCLGIEMSESGIASTKQKALEAQMGRIDQPLTNISDKSFDYSICNVSLQMVMYPEVLFSEMKRVSKKIIISIPNFAHYKNRLDHLLKGRMPQPQLFGYQWYNTGHIHQLSINDFKEFCRQNSVQITRTRPVSISSNPLKAMLMKNFPNLFSEIQIFELEP